MNIRNFCIIAHIDHGKSTLADRMLEITGAVRKIDHNQMLDRMDIEQERGITIKLTPARMQRKGYEFNLIDTPWHVDFQYEVSRSLAAVEWAILLIDASQGIQAQTLSVLYQAIDQNLTIIPVLNKIDLPAANPERVAHEIENVIGIDKSEIIHVSGKTGENVEKVLDAIIEKIQDPQAFSQQYQKKFWLHNQQPTWGWDISRALIFDSVYDPYKGVLAYVKVVDGELRAGQQLHLIYTENNIMPTEVGHFTPDYHADKVIKAGQIGYIVTGEKSVRDISIWDTILKADIGKIVPHTLHEYSIPGFKKVKPFVYAGVYPIDTNEYDKLKDGLEKLSLNDSAIEYELEDSKALWFGFRCGFLGMLHMDIVKERLSREYNIETIFTIPTVIYLIKSKNLALDSIKSGANITALYTTGMYKHIMLHHEKWYISEENKDNEQMRSILQPRIVVKSWADMIDQWLIDEIWEPIASVEIVWPETYAGNIMALCQEYRGKLINMEYIDETRVVWHYELPMGEIIIDFYDRLKSATKWYATMNYEFKKYQRADLIKLDVYINNEKVEALSRVIHKDKAYYVGKEVVEKLKTLIPKHLFVIPLQAGIGNKMIARENISAMKKDVLAKCYWWDVTRKRKLLAKQKEGKKRMKAIGNVNVPSDVFIKMVARSD